MSQYFRPRRATTSSATSNSLIPYLFPSNDGSRNDGSDDLDNIRNQATSSAILIFPNPPSEQESSRSATGSGFGYSGSSTLSLPTDVSLESMRSRSRSRSRGEREQERVHSRHESWQAMLRTLPRNSRGRWDELLPEEQSEWELELESGNLNPENTRFTNPPPRGRHTRTSSGVSSPLSLPFMPLSPQPPFRLPFLSFLQSFLTLDESTLHLISRSPDPHVSSLFPVSPGLHSVDKDDEDDDTADDAGDGEPPHGALRLLLNNPDKPQNTALHKAGIDPSEIPGEVNPFLVSPTQIPVWRLLGFVIEGGVRAWREVGAWRAGDLMGV